MAAEMTTTLDYFDEIRQLFSEDDAAGITRELEAMGYHSGDSYECHCQKHRRQLCLFLGLAAALTKNKSYSEETTRAIIDCVSSAIDTFTACSYIIHYKSIKKPRSYNCIPFSIRKALSQDAYTEEVGKQITELNPEKTEALLFYITDKIDRMEFRFTAPLLKAAYRTIDNAMFYVFLEFSVKQPENNSPSIGVLISGPGEMLFGGEMIPVQMSFRKGNKGQQPEEGKKEATGAPKEDDSTKA